jgi:capsular exopolysaccharide synthesis family protein
MANPKDSTLATSTIANVADRYEASIFHDRVQTSDFKAFMRAIIRRRRLIALTFLFFVVVTAIIVFNLRPVYTSTTSLMLSSNSLTLADTESVLPSITVDTATLLSQIEVIQSRDLIARVVDKLELVEDPEFNRALRPPKWYESLFDLRGHLSNINPRHYISAKYHGYVPEIIWSWLDGLTQRADSDEVEGEDNNAEQEKWGVVGAVTENLSVEHVKDSWIIDVAFESHFPEKAALIASTIADQYLVNQLEAKLDATQRAMGWLTDRLAVLETELEEKESEVEAFRASLAAGAGRASEEVLIQQLTELSSELVVARAERSSAEARFRRVRDLLGNERLAAASGVITSPLMVSLREQLALLKRESAELSSTYGPRHPNIVNIQAEIDDIQTAIATEIEKVVENQRTELEVAQIRESAIESSLEALEERASVLDQESVKLRQLEREAEASRSTYETFLENFKETQEREKIEDPDARLVAHAIVPSVPSFPARSRAIFLSGVVGIAAGVLLVFILELLDNRFRSSEQIRRALGYGTLAAVPRVRGLRKAKDILGYAIKNRTSSMTEAIRGLRTQLVLSNADRLRRVFLFTSSVPGEGKSVTALLFAEEVSRIGKSTIVVDCDLRRPSLSAALDLTKSPGLVEVMRGEAGLNETIYNNDAWSFHILPSRGISSAANDMLSSTSFEKMILELKTRYDVVILDTSPTLATADVSVIGRCADAIVYMVKWDDTTRETVKHGINSLRDVGLDLTGIVLTQVDLRQLAKYGHEQLGSYMGKYKQYQRN